MSGAAEHERVERFTVCTSPPLSCCFCSPPPPDGDSFRIGGRTREQKDFHGRDGQSVWIQLLHGGAKTPRTAAPPLMMSQTRASLHCGGGAIMIWRSTLKEESSEGGGASDHQNDGFAALPDGSHPSRRRKADPLPQLRPS